MGKVETVDPNKRLEAENIAWRKMVGMVIAGCRTEKGLGQKELGEKIGRTRGWVAKMETGARRIEFGEVVFMAEVLGFLPEEVIKRILYWSAPPSARSEKPAGA